ncbi:MAG: thiamine-phosphate kinase [Phycisphaerales bacterium JB063]
MKEFDLIAGVVACNANLPGHVLVPPGDDMAVVRIGGADVLVAVDQVIAGVHYDPATTPMTQVARKAVCRNLSDVAAMAALPSGMVCCVALPKSMDEQTARRLLEAVRATGERYGCPLVGGDTGMHDGPLALSVTVLAEPGGVAPVTRSGAQPGDLLYVSGQLGGTQIEHAGSTKHLDFEPRLAIARQLAGDAGTRPRAMIDLSDGLARDVRHLTAHAALSAEDLPLADAAHSAASLSGEPAYRHALGDGEDHELLFAVEPAQRAAVEARSSAALALTCIGRVTDHGGLVVTHAGSVVDLAGLGWEHSDD